jgi:hypothetical protein
MAEHSLRQVIPPDNLAQQAHDLVTDYRERHSQAALDRLDQAITDALWHTNGHPAPIGCAHERQIWWALAWFTSVIQSDLLKPEELRDLAIRLHGIERIVSQLSDEAGRAADRRA